VEESMKKSILFLVVLLLVTSPGLALVKIDSLANDPGLFWEYEVVSTPPLAIDTSFLQSTYWDLTGFMPDCTETETVLADPSTAPDWSEFESSGATFAVETTRSCDPCLHYKYEDQIPGIDGRLEIVGLYENANFADEPTCLPERKVLYDAPQGGPRVILFDASIGTSWIDILTTPFYESARVLVTSRIVGEGTVRVPAGFFESILVRNTTQLDYPPYDRNMGEDLLEYSYIWLTDELGIVAEIRGAYDDSQPGTDPPSVLRALVDSSLPLVKIESGDIPTTTGDSFEFYHHRSVDVTLDLEGPYWDFGEISGEVESALNVPPGDSINVSYFPDADFAVRTDRNGITDYIFYKYPDSGSWYSDGSSIREGEPDEMVIVTGSPEEVMRFPLVEGITWEDLHSDVVYTPIINLTFEGTITKTALSDGIVNLPSGVEAPSVLLTYHVLGDFMFGPTVLLHMDQFEWQWIAPGYGPVVRIRSEDDLGGVTPGHGDTITALDTWRLSGFDPVTPLPSEQLSVSDVSQCDQVTLTWTQSADPDVIGYYIYFADDPDLLAASPPIDVGPVPSSTVGGLDNGSDYFFAVSAYNLTTESELSNVIAAKPDQVEPPLFSGIESVSTEEECNSLRLSWSPVSDNCPGSVTYHIYISEETGGEDFSSPAYVATDAEFSVPGLNPNKTYYFVVRAADSSGNEDSNLIELSGTPGGLFLPTFDAVTADRSGASSSPTMKFTVTNEAGSRKFSDLILTLPGDSFTYPLDRDPDGVVGLWEVDRPYSGIFFPSFTAPVLALNADTAFVDMNLDGEYTEMGDHVLYFDEFDIEIALSHPDDAPEGETTAWRLSLFPTVLVNPSLPESYEVEASFISTCGQVDQALTAIDVEPCSCPTGTAPQASTLRVTKDPDGIINVSWETELPDSCFSYWALLVSDSCESSNPTPYHVFRQCWMDVSHDDLDADITNRQWSGNLKGRYVLVVAASDDGTIGDLGHYGF
jgi:hypothetical protein